MNLGIIGIGHAFIKQYNALKTFKNINLFICDKDIEKLSKINEINKTTNYKDLINCDYILITTNPDTHLEIAKYFLENNKKIILEKPMVINIEELNLLEKYKNNIFSSLHFAQGLEIKEYLKYNNKKPKFIKVYISDKYVKRQRIITESINLNGSYLDEAINPLSALCTIYGYNIKFINVDKKYYNLDKYDYYSKSNFIIENIPVNVEVDWNEINNDKYIDLIFDNEIIRLDSMNQKIINLLTNKTMFSGVGDRMTNHYIGIFNDFLNNKNTDNSFKLHREVLKGCE